MPKRGHPAPNLDYAAKPESDQLSFNVDQPPAAVPDETTETTITGESEMVDPSTIIDTQDFPVHPDAAPQVSRELKEARDEWDRRNGNHPMTSRQIRKDIGGAMLDGSDIEQLEKPKSSGGKRPRKDRRHLSSKQKMAADDTPESVRERASHIKPREELTEEEIEIGRRAIEVARRDLGFDK